MTQRMMQAVAAHSTPQTDESISETMRKVIQNNFKRNLGLQNALFSLLDKLNRADSFNKSYCFEGLSCFLYGAGLTIDMRETEDFEALLALSKAVGERWTIYATGVAA